MRTGMRLGTQLQGVGRPQSHWWGPESCPPDVFVPENLPSLQTEGQASATWILNLGSPQHCSHVVIGGLVFGLPEGPVALVPRELAR